MSFVNSRWNRRTGCESVEVGWQMELALNCWIARSWNGGLFFERRDQCATVPAAGL
jgi:hypothetical protein